MSTVNLALVMFLFSGMKNDSPSFEVPSLVKHGSDV